MKKLYVFSPWERAQAGMLKELLAKEGIECILKNDQLSAGMGEIPFTECYPELWLIDEEVYPRAKLFLDDWLKNELADAEPWLCTGCGEVLAAQFDACWSCDRERDTPPG